MRVPNIKFHGNPSSRSRVDTCGQTSGRTDITNTMGVFRDYSNTLNKDAKSRYVSCVRKMRNSGFYSKTLK